MPVLGPDGARHVVCAARLAPVCRGSTPGPHRAGARTGWIVPGSSHSDTGQHRVHHAGNVGAETTLYKSFLVKTDSQIYRPFFLETTKVFLLDSSDRLQLILGAITIETIRRHL